MQRLPNAFERGLADRLPLSLERARSLYQRVDRFSLVLARAAQVARVGLAPLQVLLSLSQSGRRSQKRLPPIGLASDDPVDDPGSRTRLFERLDPVRFVSLALAAPALCQLVSTPDEQGERQLVELVDLSVWRRPRLGGLGQALLTRYSGVRLRSRGRGAHGPRRTNAAA